LGMRQSENLALTIMYYGAVVTEERVAEISAGGR
jgi:hypothetical protein